ncbi:MAG: riboflavin synthase [Dehalococcoidia bacterium]|nr:MAG: riboflavin synthase [Dehalococcoidia bacterium]
MFTGIVEEIGVVKDRGQDRLAVEANKVLEGMKSGDSIAVNGACLTVVSLDKRRFSANIMPETLRRTNLGVLHYNDQVNLERALALGGRLGGHLVLGHIDDTGEVMDMTDEEGGQIMRISAPARLMPYIVDKGSIAIDGVSLTVAAFDALSFVVSLVAYTTEHTTLGMRRPGDKVNLETDIIAKYVEGLTERRRQDLSLEFLSEYGFVEGTDAS